MSTGITKRLKKLETATGVNAPCPVCELLASFKARIQAWERVIGIAPRRARACDLTYIPCSWCLRPNEVDYSGMSISERALWEKWNAIHDAGLRCANEDVKAEFDAMLEAVVRRIYGKHYEAYAAMLDQFTEDLRQIRGAPKILYLCRVPACQCLYAKTEEEARANIEKKMKAA